jgi:hypothetical protein
MNLGFTLESLSWSSEACVKQSALVFLLSLFHPGHIYSYKLHL